MSEIKQYYGKRAMERRRQFNNIINGIDMVLINNIPEVDASVWENWQDKTPTETSECDWFVNDATEPAWCCGTHMYDGTGDYPTKYNKDTKGEHPEQCDFAENEMAEVYQWYAVNDNDADFLKSHNQYITYSDMLDTYFLAITHFGTGWDYVDSMVADFDDCYTGLEDFPDAE